MIYLGEPVPNGAAAGGRTQSHVGPGGGRDCKEDGAVSGSLEGLTSEEKKLVRKVEGGLSRVRGFLRV